MAVYIARRGSDGPVKIGYTKHASGARRFVALQTAIPEQLTMLRLLDGGVELERALHERFDAIRIRGEWFAYSKEMAGDLGASDLPIEEPKPPRKRKWWLHHGYGPKIEGIIERHEALNGELDHVTPIVDQLRDAIALIDFAQKTPAA